MTTVYARQESDRIEFSILCRTSVTNSVQHRISCTYFFFVRADILIVKKWCLFFVQIFSLLSKIEVEVYIHYLHYLQYMCQNEDLFLRFLIQ
jgi:hypothetical protein